MHNSFRALRNRNYRLYFSGQLISVIGNGMQMMVQAWLVYRITHSAAWLGVIAACGQIPAFFASPLAGVVADQRDRRKILIWVQVFGMIQSFALAVLVFSGKVQAWQVAVLSVVLGLLNSFEITTRHAFSVDLVGKEDLSSAIAMNSATINGSRVLGPALGGALIAPLGEGWCFFLNGLSFLAVIYGLVAMDFRGPIRKKMKLAETFDHLADALKYLKRTPTIVRLMVLATFIAFVGFSFSVLLPVVAKDVLQGDATTLAWLTGASGFGAVLGAVFLGSSAQVRSINQRMFLFIFLMGVGYALLGVSARFPVVVLAMFVVGVFMMGAFPIINSAIQLLVDDSMRGRVMSLYTMTFFGATPVGSLLAGYLSDRVGPQKVALWTGILCIAVGLMAPAIAMRRDPEVKEVA